MKLGDRICLLNNGHVEQIDTPQAFRNQPKNKFVEEFMGSHLEQDKESLQLKDLNITCHSQKKKHTMIILKSIVMRNYVQFILH